MTHHPLRACKKTFADCEAFFDPMHGVTECIQCGLVGWLGPDGLLYNNPEYADMKNIDVLTGKRKETNMIPCGSHPAEEAS